MGPIAPTRRLGRLEPLDVAYLTAETATVPLHLGAVATFEGDALVDGGGVLRLSDLRAHVVERLAALPRFRCKARLLPAALGGGWWEEDSHFDIAHHVRSVAVEPPGGDDELFALAARVGGSRLDRAHPLWELWFVTGLADGRVGLVEKIHHALADGVSGVDMMAALTDSAPGPATPQAARPSIGGPPRPSPPLDVAPYLAHAAEEARRQLTAARTLLVASAHPLRTWEAGVRGAWQALRMASGGLIAPATSLNRTVGGQRRLVAVNRTVGEARAIARARGGTVNDVVLAAVTGGLRLLLLSRGERPPEVLRALVPVNTRSADEHLGAPNRTSAIVAALPVGEADQGRRFAAIAADMATRKRDGHAALNAAELAFLGVLPGPLVARIDRAAIHRQRLVNLVVTNVVGPPSPLYLMGAKMLDAVPLVPLGGNLTVGVAVLSYDGRLSLGLHADPVACPDLDVLAEGIRLSFEQLRSDVGADSGALNATDQS